MQKILLRTWRRASSVMRRWSKTGCSGPLQSSTRTLRTCSVWDSPSFRLPISARDPSSSRCARTPRHSRRLSIKCKSSTLKTYAAFWCSCYSGSLSVDPISLQCRSLYRILANYPRYKLPICSRTCHSRWPRMSQYRKSALWSLKHRLKLSWVEEVRKSLPKKKVKTNR